jgi:hypothetical protein
MGKAWRILHMHKTRMRERMCITLMLTLRHTWTQAGLHIKWSFEFFDLHTNSTFLYNGYKIHHCYILQEYIQPFPSHYMRNDTLTDKEDCNSRIAECERTYSQTAFFAVFPEQLSFLNAIFSSSFNKQTACSSENLLPTYMGHSGTRLKNTI